MKTYTKKHHFSPNNSLATGLRLNGRWLLLIIFAVCFFKPIKAQPNFEYAVHANIVYHFTKYIAWPESKQSGDFVIGVVGYTPLFEALKKTVADKTAGTQKITVKKLTAAQSSFDCHILFIAQEKSDELKKIAARTANEPVLLVCEDEDAASRGAAINFTVVDDRLKLEINKNTIKQHRLSIASELLRLGIQVK